MIKRIFIILFGFSFLATGKATSQSFSSRAVYEIKLAEDVFFFEGVLSFSDRESSFSFKKNEKKKWLREDVEKFQHQVIYTDISGHQVYRNYSSENAIIRAFCRQNEPVVYEDKIELNWKLGNSEKNIRGLVCRDASVKFRGREYEVWYTLTIPASVGPWKFYGLPGLIVEVSDIKGEVSILLKSLNRSTNNQSIQKVAEGGKMTITQFNQCLDKAYVEAYNKNRANIAKLQAKFPDLEISDNSLSEARTVATELNFTSKK